MSFYLNWFGKYMIAWAGLNFFGKNKWEKFDDDELALIDIAIRQSDIYKKLKRKGKNSKQIVKILVDKYNLLNLVEDEFEEIFGVEWPL